MLIQPITIRLLAYGQAANVAAIRHRAGELLRGEHGTVDEAAFAALPAAEAHAEITRVRWDAEVPLKKPTASRAGILITLAGVHERLTTEWLFELPIAKTCVAFASWKSARDGQSWQLLIAQGRHWSENRPPA